MVWKNYEYVQYSILKLHIGIVVDTPQIFYFSIRNTIQLCQVACVFHRFHKRCVHDVLKLIHHKIKIVNIVIVNGIILTQSQNTLIVIYNLLAIINIYRINTLELRKIQNHLKEIHHILKVLKWIQLQSLFIRLNIVRLNNLRIQLMMNIFGLAW